MPKKEIAVSTNKNWVRIANYILLGTFTLFLILFTTSKLTNEDDYFLHLTSGRYIVEGKSVPSEDIYSFPTQGVRWIPYEWLWSVSTFLIFQSFGYTGLSILNTAVFFLIFTIYFLILRKFNVSYTLIFLFFTLFIFGIFERLTPRPHIASYLFFTFTILILINYKYFRRNNAGSYRQLFFLPLIFLFWANMHMGVIAGITLLSIFLLSEIIFFVRANKYFSTKKADAAVTLPLSKSELIRLILIYIATVLAMLLNPQGLNTYIFTASLMKMKTLEYVSEYLSPFNPKFSGRFFIVIYMFFLFGGILILYYAKKKRDLFALISYSAFAVNSLRALRFTVDFLMITFVYFVLAVSFAVNSIENKKIRDFINVRPELKIIIIISLVFFLINIPNNKLYHSSLKYTRFFGVGLDSNYYPIKMFDFMKENKIAEIGERPFNTYECGGFFIWNFPGKKNFKDGRSINDESMNEFQTIYSKLPGYEKKIKDYNIDYVIIAVPDIVSEPQIMQHTVISYFFQKQDDWKLVFWNDRSMLFVKNIPKFHEVISKREYKFVNAYNFSFERNILDKAVLENKEIVKKEIDRKLSEEPNGIVINSILRTYGAKLK